MIKNNFSENLKKLRIKHNLRQSDIAKMLNISQGAYAKYESSQREPSFDILLKISSIFNVSIDSLLNNSLTIKVDNLYKSKINYEINNDILEPINLIEKLKKKKAYYLKEQQKLENLLYTHIPNRLSEIDSLINYLSSYNNLDKNINEEYADELAPDVINLKDYKKEIVYREVPDYGYIPAGKLSVTYEDDVEFISIPEHNLCSYKDYYILHISGDSMNKLFDDGEAILVEETSDVFPNDIVVARIDDKATVKKLYNTSECIKLIPLSTNPNHKIQVIKSKDIVFQGRVCGKLSDYL